VSRARAALLLLWLSIGMLPGVAAAERLAITSYSTGEGLAGSFVSAVLHDSRGFVWFGTRDGVSRFDGVRFVNYGVEDGLSDPTVNDIIESRTGDHWMATNGGGCKLAASALPPGGSRPLAARSP
jgi:ligand-binding sensor domain-containing protein